MKIILFSFFLVLVFCFVTADDNYTRYILGINIRTNRCSELMYKGEYDAALRTCKKALELADIKKLPENNPHRAEIYYLIGKNYMLLKEYNVALLHLQKSLKIYTNRFGDRFPGSATSAYEIGLVYLQMGEYEKSRSYLAESFKMTKNDMNFSIKQQLALAERSYSLGVINKYLGKTEEHRKYSKESIEQIESYIRLMFSILDEQQRIRLVSEFRYYFDKYLSLFDRISDVSDNYIHLLRWKSSSLVALIADRDTIFATEDPKLKILFDKRRILVEEYSVLSSSNPENKNNEESSDRKASDILNKISIIDRNISFISTEYRNTHKLTNAKVEEICKAIPEDTVMIDFLKYGKYDAKYFNDKDKLQEKWEKRYTIFVINGGKGCENISRVEVVEAERIDSMINELHDALSKGDTNKMRSPQRFLSMNLWEPVAQKIKGKKKIYIVPDGAIAKLPFDVLLDSKEEMLIKNLTIGYLDLPQSIITMADKERKHNSGFIAVGGVDFDDRIDETTEKKLIASKGVAAEKVLYAMSDKTGKGAVTRGNNESEWGSLPGTGKELKEIVPMMKKKEKDGVELSGKEATKKAVSVLMQRKRYIMLGTHGKFEGIKTLEIRDDMRGFADTAPKVTAEYDPMRTSYLVFAGANKEKEAAYLTAAEIMVLDLRGTELAVLSSCQTGLGDENSGEGIMGLRRAFIGAGSDSLVLSLWEISDEATTEIMKTFMEERMKNTDTVEAMRKAKLKLMESDPNPIYWAPFVVTGK